MAKRYFRYRVERDGDFWIVIRYSQFGSSVVYRGDEAGAKAYAKRMNA